MHIAFFKGLPTVLLDPSVQQNLGDAHPGTHAYPQACTHEGNQPGNALEKAKNCEKSAWFRPGFDAPEIATKHVEKTSHTHTSPR